MFSKAILLSKVSCRTVSKALLKSRAIRQTNVLVASMSVIVCIKAIRAAAVDPIGQDANWSPKERCAGGSKITGYKNSLTTIRSNVLLRAAANE